MAYERLNLADGDVLKAEHLAHMEDQLAQGASLDDVTTVTTYWCENASLEMNDADDGVFVGVLEGIGYSPLSSGLYTVTFNGSVYEGLPLKVFDIEGDILECVGNIAILKRCWGSDVTEGEDTGESFCVLLNMSGGDGSLVVYTVETANPATLSVYGPVFIKIGKEYLPEDVVNSIPYTLEIYNDGSDWVVDGWVAMAEGVKGTHQEMRDAFEAKRPIVAYIKTDAETVTVPLTSYTYDYCFVFHSPYADVDGNSRAHTWIVSNSGSVFFDV